MKNDENLSSDDKAFSTAVETAPLNDHNVNTQEVLKPPITETGVIGWLKSNLFNSPLNTLVTFFILFCFYKIIPPFVKWAFIDSVWFGPASGCQAGEGACWAYIPSNIRFVVFGLYPAQEQWRALIAMFIMVGTVVYSRKRERWNTSLIYVWGFGTLLVAILLKGGLLGLAPVESSKWGGLVLTLLLSVVGMTAAYPFGIVLALARRSNMPAIRTMAVVYIEMIRGVPLISLLFMSAVMFPLFLPEGVTINKIFRAQTAIILFTAAYIAEVVRGGLQAMPKGQYEAAESMGLNYWQMMRLVILPQALKIVIPPTVGVLISAFKDTSLVAIIALYDLLRTCQSTLSDPKWMGFSNEAYIFIAGIYFIFCYAMASYSRRLEDELSAGQSH
ncbi:amino-acid transporter subunit; membrane component of ABC superfamily [Desulfamplus magnetovallimortis]|uniref:Amino-acid transporter subunit membrane component of ABC superfamily n=1 Tax=Desulfamplus magnetovallimortis TaxID=1246637 RepID=A0A1W1H4R1_9BACT|nr:amino acid ABC transporter permease [Desulfamplus magnetovallimortis]SLM27470.1 amino-acid transporter subunit; membrane component of ABC superfamily [Desulfamplus magnetovallimortis]